MKVYTILKKGFVLMACILVMSCHVPKDPHKSWENVMKNGLHVGVVYTNKDSKQNEVIDSEYKLIKNFAKNNGLKITVVEDNETTLINKLENYQLNVVIGGFDKKSPWKKSVGMTTTYDGKHVMFIPKGENDFLFHLEKFIYENK